MLTIIIVIVVIIILITNDSSKSSSGKGRIEKHTYNSKSYSTTRRQTLPVAKTANKPNDSIKKAANSQAYTSKPKPALVDKFLDAVEQSKSDYDKNESKKFNLEMEHEFERIVKGYGDLIIDDLSQYITADIFKTYTSNEWLINTFFYSDCYQTFRCGFFRKISAIFPNSGVDEGEMLSRFFKIRKEVEKKVFIDYENLGEETANKVVGCFSNILGECLTQGSCYAEEYAARDIKLEKA